MHHITSLNAERTEVVLKETNMKVSKLKEDVMDYWWEVNGVTSKLLTATATVHFEQPDSINMLIVHP